MYVHGVCVCGVCGCAVWVYTCVCVHCVCICGVCMVCAWCVYTYVYGVAYVCVHGVYVVCMVCAWYVRRVCTWCVYVVCVRMWNVYLVLVLVYMGCVHLGCVAVVCALGGCVYVVCVVPVCTMYQLPSAPHIHPSLSGGKGLRVLWEPRISSAGPLWTPSPLAALTLGFLRLLTAALFAGRRLSEGPCTRLAPELWPCLALAFLKTQSARHLLIGFVFVGERAGHQLHPALHACLLARQQAAVPPAELPPTRLEREYCLRWAWHGAGWVWDKDSHKQAGAGARGG